MKNETTSKLGDVKWARRMAEIEDQYPSVSVGGMACDLGMLRVATSTPAGVFGRFLEFARRKDRLTIEDLAARIAVDLPELMAIENDPSALPRPRTVHKLAEFLHIPVNSLMSLAGLVQEKRPAIGSAAIRFAARSESTAELTSWEQQAFDEFVKVLVEATD